MDKQACNKLLPNIIEKYLDKLRLYDWKITFECCELDDCEAIVDYEASYNIAHIKFDNKRIKNKSRLDTAVRHELLHLYHAEVDILGQQLEVMLTKSSFKCIDKLLEHCCEMIVWRLERLLDG